MSEYEGRSEPGPAYPAVSSAEIPVQPQHITDEDIIELSVRLWSSDAYGATAISMLDSMRKEYIFYACDAGLLPRKARSNWPLHQCNLPVEELESMALANWDKRSLPFAPIIAPHPPLPGLVVRPGAVTPEYLRACLQATDPQRWSLHGSLGKARGLLKVLSGLASAEEIGHTNYSYEEPLVTQEEFEGRLEALGLSYLVRWKMISRIREQVIRQQWPLRSLRNDLSEVVFEGEVSARSGTHLELTYEQVAVRSLFGLYRNRRDSVTMKFLRGFLESAC